jgi:hypothetical protein
MRYVLLLQQVDVQLEPPARVNLMPSLDEIQECINKSAQVLYSTISIVI